VFSAVVARSPLRRPKAKRKRATVRAGAYASFRSFSRDGIQTQMLRMAFSLPHDLRDSPHDEAADRALLTDTLAWFDKNLETPARSNRTKSEGFYRRKTRVIAWFKDTSTEHLGPHAPDQGRFWRTPGTRSRCRYHLRDLTSDIRYRPPHGSSAPRRQRWVVRSPRPEGTPSPAYPEVIVALIEDERRPRISMGSPPRVDLYTRSDTMRFVAAPVAVKRPRRGPQHSCRMEEWV
jgi:hypothetical protein